MKFKANTPFDSYWFGAISGLAVVVLITSIIIAANSGDFPVWDHYKYFFDSGDISSILRARVLLSVKGGGLAVLPLFYLFLNKKMYKSVKGLMGIVLLLVFIVIYGYFTQG